MRRFACALPAPLCCRSAVVGEGQRGSGPRQRLEAPHPCGPFRPLIFRRKMSLPRLGSRRTLFRFAKKGVQDRERRALIRFALRLRWPVLASLAVMSERQRGQASNSEERKRTSDLRRRSWSRFCLERSASKTASPSGERGGGARVQSTREGALAPPEKTAAAPTRRCVRKRPCLPPNE